MVKPGFRLDRRPPQSTLLATPAASLLGEYLSFLQLTSRITERVHKDHTGVFIDITRAGGQCKDMKMAGSGMKPLKFPPVLQHIQLADIVKVT